MDSDGTPLLPHGGYRNLRSYKVAEAVYDATVVFCRRFFPQDRRMTDQMVQAARSGVRNISEGSGAAATSRKTEMKLTNVARASLNDELLRDYESFLRQNGLRLWPGDSREARAMRDRLSKDRVEDLPTAPPGRVRLTGLAGLADFVAQASPELAANALVCAVHQAAYLLKRQIESQGRSFLREGGFTENLYRQRVGVKGTAGVKQVRQVRQVGRVGRVGLKRRIGQVRPVRPVRPVRLTSLPPTPCCRCGSPPGPP